METTIFYSAEINTLADLKAAIDQMIASGLPAAPEAITLIDALKIKLIGNTLSDGSRFYDIKLIES